MPIIYLTYINGFWVPLSCLYVFTHTVEGPLFMSPAGIDRYAYKTPKKKINDNITIKRVLN